MENAVKPHVDNVPDSVAHSGERQFRSLYNALISLQEEFCSWVSGHNIWGGTQWCWYDHVITEFQSQTMKSLLHTQATLYACICFPGLVNRPHKLA